MVGDPAISAVKLTYCVGSKTIVDAASLQVGAGEFVAVVGPNGAGKSSLIGLMAGDLRPSGGSVAISGTPVDSSTKSLMAQLRTVMPQRTSVSFPFTAYEVVMMGRHPYQSGWRQATDHDRRVAESAMKETGVFEFKDRIYSTLSGGEQRRVALARAFAQQTDVLLLDEPTSALDIGHQELVMQRCREKASSGQTLLAVLHELNVAAAYADKIAVMLEGKIVAYDVPEVVFQANSLETVFDYPVLVTKHPESGKPVILPSGDSVIGMQSNSTKIGVEE
tara:strand:+ start:171 stop:1004 length:834 start_codon:yes stop_codon:yes gene_type:complete